MKRENKIKSTVNDLDKACLLYIPLIHGLYILISSLS